jgi:hypothetical protein
MVTRLSHMRRCNTHRMRFLSIEIPDAQQENISLSVMLDVA